MRLGPTAVSLQTTDPAIADAWRQTFGQPVTEHQTAVSPITLTLSLTDQIDPLSDPDFVDDAVGLTVAQTDDAIRFCFHAGALLTWHRGETAVRGQLALHALPYLEDIVWTALSPLLRRQGCFLIHAFGAVKEGRGVLLVGPSGSGKTTTGLTLLQHGWRLWGNDTVLLSRTGAGVIGWPTPGTVGIRPFTANWLGFPQAGQYPASTILTALGSEWAAATKVTAVYFPQVAADQPTQAMRLDKGIGLVRLLEASVDRWDRETLPAHLMFLRALVGQTAVYQLGVGTHLLDWAETFGE